MILLDRPKHYHKYLVGAADSAAVLQLLLSSVLPPTPNSEQPHRPSRLSPATATTTQQVCKEEPMTAALICPIPVRAAALRYSSNPPEEEKTLRTKKRASTIAEAREKFDRRSGACHPPPPVVEEEKIPSVEDEPRLASLVEARESFELGHSIVGDVDDQSSKPQLQAVTPLLSSDGLKGLSVADQPLSSPSEVVKAAAPTSTNKQSFLSPLPRPLALRIPRPFRGGKSFDDDSNNRTTDLVRPMALRIPAAHHDHSSPAVRDGLLVLLLAVATSKQQRPSSITTALTEAVTESVVGGGGDGDYDENHDNSSISSVSTVRRKNSISSPPPLAVSDDSPPPSDDDEVSTTIITLALDGQEREKVVKESGPAADLTKPVPHRIAPPETILLHTSLEGDAANDAGLPPFWLVGEEDGLLSNKEYGVLPHPCSPDEEIGDETAVMDKALMVFG